MDETIGDDEEKKAGFKDEELKVKIPKDEVSRLIKEYKKIKKPRFHSPHPLFILRIYNFNLFYTLIHTMGRWITIE